MHILVADDNDANCLITQTILERAGHLIVTACNGSQAFRLTKLVTYDLIILDIMMPVMNGLQALKLIRKESSLNQKTPIFALTAYCDFEDRQRYGSAGFDAILAKPLRRSDLETAFVRFRNKDCPTVMPLVETDTSNHIALLDDEMVSLLKDCGTADNLSIIQYRFWASMHKKCYVIRTHLPPALRGDEVSLSELRRAVHAVKGAASSIGLARVAHICRRLRNAPVTEIPRLMCAFITAVSASRLALNVALSGTRQLNPSMKVSGQNEPEAPHDSQDNRSAIRN